MCFTAEYLVNLISGEVLMRTESGLDSDHSNLDFPHGLDITDSRWGVRVRQTESQDRNYKTHTAIEKASRTLFLTAVVFL